MEIEQKSDLEQTLAHLPSNEQKIWLEEAFRLSEIVVRYQAIKRKRKLDRKTGKYDFTAEVYELCAEAKTSNPIIVSRESKRARLHHHIP